MSAPGGNPTESRNAARCAECESRLAHDQRYCLECGARRGPLPRHVSQLIGAIHERGPAAALSAGAPAAESVAGIGAPSQRLEFAMPGPRAAAAAVIGMLGFGVIVGSLAAGTPVAQLASAPLVVVGLSHQPTATPTPSRGQNVIVTEIESGDAGAAPSAGAAPAAPAQVQAPAQVAVSPSPSSLPSSGTDTTPSSGLGGLPPVKHVFLIVLSDRGFSQSFGAGRSYLSGALRRQGELVQNYYAVAGAPLANEIALVSGQGPTPQTASDCPSFTRITPGRKGVRGQVLGDGCVYPPATNTLANQLAASGNSWKAYVGGLPAGARTACRVPKLGSKQPQMPHGPAGYLAWRNPFVYFRSLTAGTACRRNEVPVGQLAKDVKSTTSAPSLAYIVPPVCADGSEAPCGPGAPPNLAAAGRFLKSVVSVIKRSAAYQDGGLVAITFDQAPQTGSDADPSACCGSPATYPNLRKLTVAPAPPPAATGTTASTPGATTTSGSTTAEGTTTTAAGTTTTAAGTTTPAEGTTTTAEGTTTTAGTTMTATTPTDTTTPTSTTTTGTTMPTDTTPTDTTPTDTTTATTTPTTPVDLGAGATTPTGGGGQVGLLLISPYVKPGSIDVVDYFNHFSLLASIESLFGLHRLGYAGMPGLPVFGLGVFNNYAG